MAELARFRYLCLRQIRRQSKSDTCGSPDTLTGRRYAAAYFYAITLAQNSLAGHQLLLPRNGNSEVEQDGSGEEQEVRPGNHVC